MPVEVITFGCRLNAYESEAIRRRAEALPDAGELYVVNTCTVTAEATRQARQAIRKIAREHPEARIVVTGCAAQVDPRSFAAMDNVALVLGNDEKMRPESWALLQKPQSGDAGGGRTLVGDIMEARESFAGVVDGAGGRVRAFMQIQNGCDHRCTFCIIPFGRGPSRSVPVSAVVAQARRLIEGGAREIVLSGVDITSYGKDLPGAPGLGTLVTTLLGELPDLPLLRLSSVDSVEVDEALLCAFAEEPRLAPHLHLSLQSGSDMILKRMKRRHLRADSVAVCERLRRLRPDIVFGADIIAGFPTETGDMFAESLSLVDECGLTFLHVFPFSPRPGTPAARMPTLPRTVVKERAKRLRDKGQEALERHLDGKVGQRLTVLSETGNTGRAADFTLVKLKKPVLSGVFLSTMIYGHNGRELLGERSTANDAR